MSNTENDMEWAMRLFLRICTVIGLVLVSIVFLVGFFTTLIWLGVR